MKHKTNLSIPKFIFHWALLKSNFVIFLIILLSLPSCRHNNQNIVLNNNPVQLTIDKYYNKQLNLKIVDGRDDKDFIGFNAPLSIWQTSEEYKNANYQPEDNEELPHININQNLSTIILQKLSASLNQKGLRLKRFTPNQLRVEILELSFVSTTYRNFINSKIRVIASNKNNDLSKTYEKQLTTYKPMLGLFLGQNYYHQIINDCLDQNIQAIILDNSLWSFLD